MRFGALGVLLSLSLLIGCGGGGSSTGNNGGNGGGSAPSAPSGLTVTAGDKQVSLTWTASSGATSYNVKRSTASGGPYTQVGTAATTSYSDTGLTNGTKYYYVVSAVNAAGESANSAEASATPMLAVPAAPAGVLATAGDQQVVLGWTASNSATSYNVKRATVTGGPYSTVASPTTPGYTDTGLTDGTAYFYVVTAVNAAGESSNSTEVSATPHTVAADVTITVDPTKTKPISPWIYGINSYPGVPNPPHFTIDRMGGNRWTAYNWENNASNAGSDFHYQSDNYLSSSSVPAEAVRGEVASDQTAGLASIMTVQMQGYVSADEAGPVDTTQPLANNLATRFKQVVDAKGSTFTTTPDTTDASVYMDEFLYAMDQKLPGIFGASPAHPTFVSLDNEPELWNTTHLEVQGPTMITSDAYITKTINLTTALKNEFPNVVILGPVDYGFQGMFKWQSELNATPNGSDWFVDKYLKAMKTASTTYGKPLVDAYDFHWYPEVYDSGSVRITDMSAATLSAADVQLIVQSTRNLWDPTYNDTGNSNPWVYNELGQQPIQLLNRMQAKIDAENPGMKISLTEYENGGWNHIAGTVAQADALGIFGAEGVFAANLWPPNGTYDYALAGFRAFRGYDGATANFGDTSLQTTSSNVANVVVYASTDSTTPGRTVFVAINRSTSSQVTAITGQPLSGTATLYQMTATSASGQMPVHPVQVGTMAASGSTLTVTLPALSVTTIEVK